MRGGGAIDCLGRGRKRGSTQPDEKKNESNDVESPAFPLPFYLYTWSFWFKPTKLLLV